MSLLGITEYLLIDCMAMPSLKAARDIAYLELLSGEWKQILAKGIRCRYLDMGSGVKSKSLPGSHMFYLYSSSRCYVCLFVTCAQGTNVIVVAITEL